MTTSRYFSWAFAAGLLASALVASSGYAMNNAAQDEKEQDGAVKDIPNKPPVASLNAQQLGKGYTMILTGDNDEVAMWRWKGNRQNVSLAGPLTVGSLTSVAFEPQGNTVAVGSSSGSVQAYNGANWQSLYTKTPHKQAVSQIAFQPEGTLAASAGDDNTIKLWDIKTGEVRATLEHKAAVQSLAFHPQDSDVLTSVSADGVVRMWDLEDLNSAGVSREFSGKPQEHANSMAMDLKGKSIVVASQDGKLRYWKTMGMGKKPSAIVEAHTGPINTLAFSAQGILASGGDDAVVKLWDGKQPDKVIVQLKAHTQPIRSVVFDPKATLAA
ncbi:MAG: WD40 repeat domain-containing protein, partial [Myxococcota bacterium]